MLGIAVNVLPQILGRKHARVDPAGEFRTVAEQPQPPVRADERLLGDFLRERRVAKPAPRHRRGARGVRQVRGNARRPRAARRPRRIRPVGRHGSIRVAYITARQRPREIVTAQTVLPVSRRQYVKWGQTSHHRAWARTTCFWAA